MNEVPFGLNNTGTIDREAVITETPELKHLESIENISRQVLTSEEPPIVVYDRPIFRAKKYEFF